MIEQLQQIIFKLEKDNKLNQLHHEIKKDEKLKQFIDEYEYPFTIKGYSEKVFYILNNPDNYYCEKRKQYKKFSGFKKGYAFCGRPDTCECNFKYFSKLSSDFNKKAYTKNKNKIVSKRRNTMEEKYGEWYTNQDKRKETCKEKYNKEHHMKTEEYKKLFSIISKESYIKGKEKYRNSSLKKYGVEHPWSSNIIRNKIKNTCIKIYGVENPLLSINIQNQIKNTNLTKFGKSIWLV